MASEPHKTVSPAPRARRPQTGDDGRRLGTAGHALVVSVLALAFGAAGEIATELEEQIEAAFGVRTPVLLRTAPELAGTLASNPFIEPGADAGKLDVVFLEHPPAPTAIAALDPDRSPPGELVVVGREVYLRLQNGAGRTRPTLDWLERRLGSRGARNWRTVTKLVELAAR